ncbi:VOC family protein [Crocosphaera sp. XPORK-15E]|uniref:VOC family protein n=1 Tax=Crocosphaera sp. XPORK-15E TaxID=3110247 RepID=UPI002B1F5A04|nr:VOC family protein [Crocosphaera sp. XPORK-15E]MEA5534020.1 VOC family protein [Crocosphaera sp. XPORK-15E]
MGLAYSNAFVTLAATNFEQVVQFYHQLLSQTPHPYQPGRYAEFQISGLRLGIFQPQPSHQQEFSNSLGSGLSLCLEVENLETAIALLTEMGYSPPGNINTASHGREIYGYDPGGNRLILHQYK